MKRQKVDFPMAVDASDSGQDSGHLVNPFMRVTKYMTRHLAPLRESGTCRKCAQAPKDHDKRSLVSPGSHFNVASDPCVDL